MHQVENIPATKVMETASCVAELFRLDETNLHGLKASDEDFLPVSVCVLGPVRLIPESTHTLVARDRVKRLHPIAMYHFQGKRGGARFQNANLDQSFQQDIGPRDMLYFTSTDSDVSGLASCRIRDSDKIWHVQHTKLGFVVRETANGGCTIIGRAYVVRSEEKLPTATTLTQWPAWDFANSHMETIHLDIATMFKLKSIANATVECAEEQAEAETAAERARVRELADEKQAEFERWNKKTAALADLLAPCKVEHRILDSLQEEVAGLDSRKEADQQAELRRGRPPRGFREYMRSDIPGRVVQQDWENEIKSRIAKKYDPMIRDAQKYRIRPERNLLWTTLTCDSQGDRFRPANVDQSIVTSLLKYLQPDMIVGWDWCGVARDSYLDLIYPGSDRVERLKEAVQTVSVSAHKIKDIIDGE
jgi:hypothetical protein